MMSERDLIEETMEFHGAVGGLPEATVRFHGEVRMEDLTVSDLWHCVGALVALVDTRANKNLYKAGGDYKERKRDAWDLAEDVLVRAGLMEVLE